VSISSCAMSELEPRPSGARGATRRALGVESDEHRLPVGELTAEDLGVGAVADAQLHGNLFGFAVRAEDPDVSTWPTARAATLAPARAPKSGRSRTLPGLGFRAGRTET